MTHTIEQMAEACEAEAEAIMASVANVPTYDAIYLDAERRAAPFYAAAAHIRESAWRYDMENAPMGKTFDVSVLIPGGTPKAIRATRKPMGWSPIGAFIYAWRPLPAPATPQENTDG